MAGAFTLKKLLRFQANAAFSAQTITYVNLLDLLCVATDATTLKRLCVAVRLKRVAIWGPPASSLVPVTVSIEYAASAGPIGGSTQLRSDTSMGATEPAYVTFVPPASTSMSMWQGASATGAAMIINGPVNSIIDVEMELVLQNGEAAVSCVTAASGATAGTVYCRGLDALASASTVFPPVSYASA